MARTTRNTTGRKTTQSKTQKSAKGAVKKRTVRKSPSRSSKRSSSVGKVRIIFLIIIPLLALSFFAGYLFHRSYSPKKAAAPVKNHVAAVKPKPAAPAAPAPVEVKEPDYAAKEYAYAPSPEPIIPEKPVLPKPELPPELPPAAPKLKKVCIILDDFGYNFNKEIRQVLDLTPAINVAILPGLEYSKQIMEYAHKGGHDIIIHAPFEGSSDSTEPRYIRRGDSEERINGLLSGWFNELPDAIGINNHQGSVATSDWTVMNHVMDYLKIHHKIFVDSLTSSNSKGHRAALAQNIPHAKRTTPFLDNEDDRKKISSYVNRWLAQAVSRKDRVPVAIGHITKKNTRQVLIDLVPKLQSMGYELVSISEVLEPHSATPPSTEPFDAAKKP